MEETIPSFFLFLGRFHPVVLHLPIGFLLLAVTLEIGSRIKKEPAWQPAITFTLGLGAIGAIFAAATGFMLSKEGGYTPTETLDEHQNQGIFLAVLAVGLFGLKWWRRNKPDSSISFTKITKFIYPALLGFMVILMVITGHHGAILTHGMGYLNPNAAPPRNLAGLSGVWAKNVASVDEKKLQSLRKQGIWVMEVAQDFPFLEASISRNENLDAGMIKALTKYDDQIIKLDLSNSPVTDDMLKQVGKLKHLTLLRLDQTKITDAGLAYLKDLEYLESLNLYGTEVTDQGIDQLSALPTLKTLFLWQTKTTPEGITALKGKIPGLNVESGESSRLAFGTVKLAPPIIYSREKIFLDETEVELQLEFDGVKLFYTLDGTEPDSTSLVYSAPFKVDTSTVIKAIAYKEGWSPSPVVSDEIVKLSNQIKSLTLANKPADQYDGAGPNTLFDLRKGTQQFREDYWLGFQAKDLICTLDYGEKRSVKKVTLSCLEDVGSYIFFPIGIKVETSNDGATFRQVATQKFAPPKAATVPSRKHFSAAVPGDITARYVRVTGQNITKNPKWHPAPGDKSWLFVDEVMVE